MGLNHSGLTRISLETRTLLMEDFIAGRGAPNVDGRACWMSPGLFRRLSDGMPLTDLLGIERLMPFQGPWPERMPEGVAGASEVASEIGGAQSPGRGGERGS